MEEDIKTLANYEAFARFIYSIEIAREEVIADLAHASTEGIQQLSGRILAYDDILKMVNWNSLRERYSQQLA